VAVVGFSNDGTKARIDEYSIREARLSNVVQAGGQLSLKAHRRLWCAFSAVNITISGDCDQTSSKKNVLLTDEPHLARAKKLRVETEAADLIKADLTEANPVV
jgi:hypothetical protein